MNDAELSRFMTETQSVLKHCRIKEETPKAKIWHQEHTRKCYFAIEEPSLDHYYNALNLLRECIFKENYKEHEKYFDRLYKYFIMSQKINDDKFDETCKNWLRHLKKFKMRKFRLLLPISYYNYKTGIVLKKFKIVKWSTEVLHCYFNTPDLKNLMPIIEKTVRDSNTEIFAIVDVKAFDPNGANNVGYSMIEKFAYLSKLIDERSSIQFGSQRAIRLSEISIIRDNKALGINVNNSNIPRWPLYVGESFNLQQNWGNLLNFLFIKRHNDLQKVIMYALYWFGISDIYMDSREKLFLNYMIGLESILLHDYKTDKARKFGENYDKIFPRKSPKFWERLYCKRNKIIHGKSMNIYREEIEMMHVDLRSLLVQLIEWSKDYKTLNNVLKEKYKIDNQIPKRKMRSKH